MTIPKTYVLVFQSFSGSLRNTSTDLRLPLCKTSNGQRSFSYRGATVWSQNCSFAVKTWNQNCSFAVKTWNQNCSFASYFQNEIKNVFWKIKEIDNLNQCSAHTFELRAALLFTYFYFSYILEFLVIHICKLDELYFFWGGHIVNRSIYSYWMYLPGWNKSK